MNISSTLFSLIKVRHVEEEMDVTSKVSDVSAILVEITTFLFPLGAGENTNS